MLDLDQYKHIHYPYSELDNPKTLPIEFIIGDHVDGFDSNLENIHFNKINQYGQENNIHYTIYVDVKYSANVTKLYDHINFIFLYELFEVWNQIPRLVKYNNCPTINYKNFICSFNGSSHTSRKLLTAILQQFGYFNNAYCSKNFSYSVSELDEFIKLCCGNDENCKYFITDDSSNFFQSVNSFGHVQYNHVQNICNLESKLTESFIHIVSETKADSYYPFVTEKFLYSVVTRGLFLAYGQPGWHEHLEKYYGFKKYTKLFDYTFDNIQNPIERLVELMNMVSKFSKLSPVDWHDLYLIEQDTVNYNYNHYYSKDYLNHLKLTQ